MQVEHPGPASPLSSGVAGPHLPVRLGKRRTDVGTTDGSRQKRAFGRGRGCIWLRSEFVPPTVPL